VQTQTRAGLKVNLTAKGLTTEHTDIACCHRLPHRQSKGPFTNPRGRYLPKESAGRRARKEEPGSRCIVLIASPSLPGQRAVATPPAQCEPFHSFKTAPVQCLSLGALVLEGHQCGRYHCGNIAAAPLVAKCRASTFHGLAEVACQANILLKSLGL
jgi:hypothetical protein